MNGDLQSRIIGLALLQGQLTYRVLEEAKAGLPPSDADEAPDLLQELVRSGALRDSTLEDLLRQVEELDRMLPVPDTRSRSEDLTRPISSLTEEPESTRSGPALDSQGAQATAQRLLWGTLPSPQDQFRGENRRLRQTLTIPKWNNYQNLQFVGEGGMGRIFRAFDPTLRRQVALKFLNRDDREMAAKLLQEAQYQAQVDHPNICKVYEVREWRGQVYVAMQYIDGTRLDLLAPRLSLTEKVSILETVARAVQAAHRLGLVHRDLKPANVMVETSEDHHLKPYVLDFGLARDLASKGETLEGTILGTVHYMAPEQARGDLSRIERRTDVYALGAMLYELLTGAPPFADSQGLDCLVRIQTESVR
ncbi:MAG TPA: serine/threonine-protein kinase, partial [Holophagaceae bacterium]